jgi:hypothetical protein
MLCQKKIHDFLPQRRIRGEPIIGKQLPKNPSKAIASPSFDLSA